MTDDLSFNGGRYCQTAETLIERGYQLMKRDYETIGLSVSELSKEGSVSVLRDDGSAISKYSKDDLLKAHYIL